MIYGSYNPFYVIELRKYSGNFSILSATIYRELSEYSLLVDNVFIEELRNTFYIFISKGPSFYLSRYVFSSNS